jgi:phage terminase large subunit-like protein
MSKAIQPDVAETAIEFAKAVLTGTIVANLATKEVAKRFLVDLETAEARGFYFDSDAAQAAVDENWTLCPPLQIFALANLFGWKQLPVTA